MHEYHVTLVIQTDKPLSNAQQRDMEHEIKEAVDDNATLPLDADLVTSSVQYVARMP